MTEVSGRLAQFAVAPSELPEPVLHAGRRTIVNAVCLAVGAARHPAADITVEVLRALDRTEQASLLGRPERLAVTDAPLANGLAVHVEDFDDTHLPTVIHPGAPVVPAALAVAEWVGASGADTLAAVVYGIEVALRVGNGITPGHFDRGWHLTGTTGRLGAAVAAGRLLDLDQNAMLVALGIAAVEAAGLQAALGTMTKSFHPGKAASDGVEAALLARHGLTGPRAPIEGRRGFAETAAPVPDYAAMLDGLGHRWEVQRNAFKPYACGIVSHPVIDAAVALRAWIGAEAVEHVELAVNPVVLDVMGVRDPKNGLQSKFSVYHSFATGFLDGAGGPAQYSDARATAGDVVALRARVETVTDPALAKDEARARVRTVTGDVLDYRVEHATGSEAAPMTDEQLRAKAHLVAASVLGEEQTDRLVDLAFAIDQLDGIAELVDAASPREAAHA